MVTAKPVSRQGCRESGCARPAHARGYCRAHYTHARKRGEFGRTCQVAECAGTVEARELCAKHYRRARYQGTLPDLPLCLVEDCGTAAYCDGLCGKHYTRKRTYGSTAPRRRPRALAVRLREAYPERAASEADLAVALSGLFAVNGPCWDWSGGLSPDGYPVATKNVRVTRLILELVGRPAAPHQHARHRCHRPVCIRPAHLVAGTAKQNKADAAEADRIVRGERHYMSRLTDDQVAVIRQRYENGGISQRELGIEYGVTQTTVSAIVTGKNRAYLERTR